MIMMLSKFAIVISCISIAVFVVVLLRYRRNKAYMGMLGDALDASGIGIVFFDEREVLRVANDQARALLPVLERPERLALRRFFNMLYDKGQEVDERIRAILSTMPARVEGTTFREVIRADNGRICLVEAQKGMSESTTITFNDFSRMLEQQSRVQQLSRINHDLIQAVEASTCGVMLTDPKTEPHSVLFMNNACRDFWDIAPAESVDMRLGEFLGRMKESDCLDALRYAFEMGETLQQETKVRKGDDVYWYDLRLAPVFDADGGLELFIVVFTDVTALKRSENEFFKAQKLEALGRLSAGVAHDFNNVLSIINGYARQIENSPQDALSHIDKIQNAARRGSELTQRMLTFSQHKVVRDAVIDLRDALEDQVALLRPVLGAGIDVALRFDGDGDAEMYAKCAMDTISQVVINLAINARDAMPDGGTLSLAVCEHDNEFWRLVVSDTGQGIPKDKLPHIFDPFYTTKEQGKGTGLGLSVVYGLLKDIGGDIDVKSTLSRGAEFTILLPKSDEAPADMLQGSGDAACNISLKGYTVMVVEDEVDLRKLMCAFLEGQGLNVIAAENGDEALCVQDEHMGDIDILITDIVMPGLNGIKLGELMKALRPDMEVIFMSGYPARGDEGNLDLPEGAAFLQKPVDMEALCVLMAKKIEVRKKQVQHDILEQAIAS